MYLGLGLVLVVVLAMEYTSAKRGFSVYRKCAMRYILSVCKEVCFGSAAMCSLRIVRYVQVSVLYLQQRIYFLV